MIGVEIRGDDGQSNPSLRDRIIQEAFLRGLLLLPCGQSTIRFCPPLCITGRHVEIGLRLFESAIGHETGTEEPAVMVRPSPSDWN